MFNLDTPRTRLFSSGTVDSPMLCPGPSIFKGVLVDLKCKQCPELLFFLFVFFSSTSLGCQLDDSRRQYSTKRQPVGFASCWWTRISFPSSLWDMDKGGKYGINNEISLFSSHFSLSLSLTLSLSLFPLRSPKRRGLSVSVRDAGLTSQAACFYSTSPRPSSSSRSKQEFIHLAPFSSLGSATGGVTSCWCNILD